MREVVRVLARYRREPRTSAHNRRRLLEENGMRDDNVLALVHHYRISPRTGSYLLQGAWDSALGSVRNDPDLTDAIIHARNLLQPPESGTQSAQSAAPR